MRVVLLIFTLFLFFLRTSVLAITYPNPQGYVNDFAGIFSDSFKTDWEYKLKDLGENKGTEIAVVTIKSLEGEEIEEYAVRLFEKWRIGKKETNNGLLLLIAPTERKVRIEVGYGLESYITDGRAGDIIRGDIVPDFAKGNYEAGVNKGLTSIIDYLAGEKNEEKKPSGGESGEWVPVVFFTLFILYVLFTYLASFLGRTREIWPGAVIGGVLGGGGGYFISTFTGLILGGIFLGLLGFILDFLLSVNYQERKKKGLATDFIRSWGGFRSGGGFGGGGSFGGFGGGSSGGGGGSGRW